MGQCLHDTWGESDEWHDASPVDDVVRWVARLSCRALNDEPLTSNEEWLRITSAYTVNVFEAITAVKSFPPPLHWLAERFLPQCRKVRSEHKKASRILNQVLDERDALVEKIGYQDARASLPDDSIEWFRTAANGRPYNVLDLQIALAISAIFTTSDLLGQALVYLAESEDITAAMRREALDALGKHGISKLALSELHLMDSFFKETQRIKPMGMTTVHRLATADVELANGVSVKKGERCAVSGHRMWTSEYYPEPEKFDAHRFVKLRAHPDWKSKALLSSTSIDHIGFGHGKHACPGRFFAADEVKVAMLHVLFKYDVRIGDANVSDFIEHGSDMMVNPEATLKVRRRTAEIDLEALAATA